MNHYEDIIMGKDYGKELRNLGIIHKSACNCNIQIIADFLKKYGKYPSLCIGSGGSYTVAAIFEYLSIVCGGIAKRITPLELASYKTQINKMAVLLFTAGGRNQDSINAYRYLSESEPKGILTCCMHENAPIKKIQRENLHNFFFEYNMPVRKDGYLAVESTVSCLIMLCRAFEIVTKNPFFSVPEDYAWDLLFDEEQLKSVFQKETIIVLYSGMTTSAAIDFESKFSEASLGNVQLVDFRNFAHGRHYWLSDRKEKTAVIAMSSRSDKAFVKKTLNLLPSEIPILSFEADDSSILGLFQAHHFVFNLVMQAGKIKGINPGKPTIEDFGKKLYHLNYNICDYQHMRDRRNDFIKMAAYRKQGSTAYSDQEYYFPYAFLNFRRLCDKKFRGIIFDFDGTIYDSHQSNLLFEQICERINSLLSRGIKIGIATGRGKSVRIELQNRILYEFWNEVAIAYYNGGCIGSLADNTQPDKNAISVPLVFKQIISAVHRLSGDNSALIDGIKDNNPYQLSVMLDKCQPSIYEKLLVLLKDIQEIKILESNHSLDIVPYNSSKTNIFQYYNELGISEDELITIGDSGQLGGNDYELLDRPFSLSVDQVSDRTNSCWNYLKPGYRNLEGTLFYLDNLEVNDNSFTIKRW